VLLSLSVNSAAEQTLRFGLVPREKVEERLGQYHGANIERETTLKKLFAEAGCGEHLSEQPVRFRPPNLICYLPGSSDRFIIVGAHFDRVLSGDGVADNWSGASLLPSLYEAIKVEPRQHTYVFVAFTAEEQGLIGSRYYVRQMTHEQISATDAMVNLDTLGLDSTNVWIGHSNQELVKALAYVGMLINSPVKGIDFEQVGSTDSESFSERKIRSLTVHSLNQKNHDAGILHGPKDNLLAMHLDDYYETYRLLSAYLVYLDHGLDAAGKTTSP
jgi:hypothetical protein